MTPGETILTPTATIQIELAENVIPIGAVHDITFGGNGTATLKLPDPADLQSRRRRAQIGIQRPTAIKVQGIEVNNVVHAESGRDFRHLRQHRHVD